MQRRIEEVMKANPELAAAIPEPAVAEACSRPGQTLEQSIDAIFDGYADRPALGMRDYEIAEDATSGHRLRRYLPSYSAISFGEVRARCHAIANAWRHDPSVAVARDDLVCMIGFASTDYFTVIAACFYAQAVPVPLQSVTSDADLDAVFARISPAAFAATASDVVVAARLAVKHGIKSLIVFDHDERDEADCAAVEDARRILAEAGDDVTLTLLERLVEIGRQMDWTFLPPHPDGEGRLALIYHSSGATGVPKGAMYDERTVRNQWNPADDQLQGVSVIFAPLNHAMGLSQIFGSLRKGSSVYFTAKPDLSTLFEDIRLIRPTGMAFFPRALELVYQHYTSEVTRKLRTGGGEGEVRVQVMDEMRNTFLGDRLIFCNVGSAPSSPVVRQFFSDCFGVDLIESYGSTECGSVAITVEDRIQRPNVIEYRLADVPELEYYTTDRPYPRGELTYKSQYMIGGYYQDPEATAGLYDEDGFLHTGDIVEERGPDHVVLIDRRKDVLKLAQAEFVAVGPLGALFEGESLVLHQTYIYGNSSKAYVLAVVVPDTDEISRRLGPAADESQVRGLIREEFQRVADEKQLKTFEVPRDFIIETEPFSRENGLLSSVDKRLRPALNRKYAGRLEALYEAHERKKEADLATLKDPASPLNLLEKLVKVVELKLGIEDLDASKPQTYEELGGDSLGAAELSLAIEDVFEVELPADSILSPTGSLGKWAGEIENRLGDTGGPPTFASVHGKEAADLHSKDLQLATFLGDATMEQATTAAPVSDLCQTVLITGANGFLGRHVSLQWMEKLARTGGKLICIVRGVDGAGARRRLDAVFAGPDPTFEARYRELAADHLKVLAGDAGEPLLGLGEETFARLAREVDRICHVAALVNHRLGYGHLFGPNVVGTGEIIRLAVTERKKPIDFVSTVGVLPLLEPCADGNEEAPLLASVPLVDQYAVGYAASKWADEHLLHRAAGELAVPVNILRGNMMLADSRYSGQINTGDLFTRLLYSIVATGLAPFSFYELSDDGTKQSQHYDGLPVDVVAASVVAVGQTFDDGCRAINIHNYHEEDGCSLDTFVDWIESAGYPVTRIEDYGEWLARFEGKLKVLPEGQKKHSAIDVLGAFAGLQSTGVEPITCHNYRALVNNWDFAKEIPHVDEAFIHKCLADMELLGLISDEHTKKSEGGPMSLQKQVSSPFSATSTADDVLGDVDLSGKVALVTGGNSGIGRETVCALAKAGARVILTARNDAKGEETASELRRMSGSELIESARLDLMSVADTVRFAEEMRNRLNRLDQLVLNAGIMLSPLNRNELGIESQFMTNYAGHLIVAAALAPLLVASAPARVVCLSSSAHIGLPVDLDDINFEQRPYDPSVSYCQSKTACALLALELNRRLSKQGVLSFGVHPGYIPDSNLWRYMLENMSEEQLRESVAASGPQLAKSPAQGAATTAWALTSSELARVGGGQYLEDCQVAEDSTPGNFVSGVAAHAREEEAATKLWDATEEMVGQRFSL